MSDLQGLSNAELKQIIEENLKERGFDPDTINIKIKKGARVILRGEVDVRRQRDLIIQTITDIVGVDDLVDNLVILQESHGAVSEKDAYDENGDKLFDQDNECVGTEDVFRSVEDGVPYIPPVNSIFEEPPEEKEKWRPGKKKEKP